MKTWSKHMLLAHCLRTLIETALIHYSCPELDISLSVSIVMLASRMENHWVWSHQLHHVCGHCSTAIL